MYRTVLSVSEYGDLRAYPYQARAIDRSGNIRPNEIVAETTEVGTIAPSPDVVLVMGRRLWEILAGYPATDGRRKGLPVSPPETLAQAMAILRGWAYRWPAHLLTADGQDPEVSLQPLTDEWRGGERVQP